MKKSAGKNIGNITADINKTVINRTPLQNPIKHKFTSNEETNNDR